MEVSLEVPSTEATCAKPDFREIHGVHCRWAERRGSGSAAGETRGPATVGSGVIGNPRFGVVLDRAVTDRIEVGASGDTDCVVAICPAGSLIVMVLGLLKILPVREQLRSLPDHAEPLWEPNP
jgi:hypothetical protein